MTRSTTNLLGEPKKRKNSYFEAKYVQKPFAKALRAMIDTGHIYRLNPTLILFEFTSTGNTWAGSAARGKIQKDMGYRKGWLDLTFLICFEGEQPFVALIECKYDTDLSDSQVEFIGKIDRAHVKRGLIRSPGEGYQLLKEWGVKV